MTTPPRQAAVWRSGQPLRFISTRSLVHPFAANAAFPLKGKQEDCAAALAPLKTVRSQSTAEPPRAEERAGMVTRTLGSIETQSREISCHPGLATFRSEISPLRFATVEMTGGAGRLFIICATSRGNERYEGKNSELYTSRTFSAFSPFGGCRHHLARWEACHMTQKVNPVTLALYSSPDRAIPQPSA